VKPQRLSWWDGHLVRRFDRGDAAVLAALAVLGTASLVTGGATARHLSPTSAYRVAQMLQQSQSPEFMPNSRLDDERGAPTTLNDETQRRMAVVTMVGEQASGEFLDALFEILGDDDDVVVLVPGTADPKLVRERLDNDGLTDLHFVRDVSGSFAADMRIHELPTTFLVDASGQVLDRTDGYGKNLLDRLRVRRALERGQRP